MCVGKNKDLFIYFSMLQIIFVLDHAVELSQQNYLFLNFANFRKVMFKTVKTIAVKKLRTFWINSPILLSHRPNFSVPLQSKIFLFQF